MHLHHVSAPDEERSKKYQKERIIILIKMIKIKEIITRGGGSDNEK